VSYKTPFSDAVGKASVPTGATKGGKTVGSSEVPGSPGRDGGLLPELSRDGAITGSPSKYGPAKTPFKDAC
jgi:hypothetical protein